MATDDDSWEHFMDSIGEEEEVETDDDDDSEDENSGTDDKSKKKGSKKSDEDDADKGKGSDDDDSDDDDSDKDDDAGDDDKDKGGDSEAYKPRLKQFFNDDGELDAEKIEKSYIANSRETKRISDELEVQKGKTQKLLDAIAAKPDIAKALFGEKGAKDLADGKAADDGEKQLSPYERHIKSQIDKQNKKQFAEFTEAHPESLTDPDKVAKISKFLSRYGKEYAEDNDGEMPTMKQALEAAYRLNGWELGQSKKEAKKEEISSASKKKAATRSTSNKKTPVAKKTKSDLEQMFATKLGVNVH